MLIIWHQKGHSFNVCSSPSIYCGVLSPKTLTHLYGASDFQLRPHKTKRISSFQHRRECKQHNIIADLIKQNLWASAEAEGANALCSSAPEITSHSASFPDIDLFPEYLGSCVFVHSRPSGRGRPIWAFAMLSQQGVRAPSEGTDGANSFSPWFTIQTDRERNKEPATALQREMRSLK